MGLRYVWSKWDKDTNVVLADPVKSFTTTTKSVTDKTSLPSSVTVEYSKKITPSGLENVSRAYLETYQADANNKLSAMAGYYYKLDGYTFKCLTNYGQVYTNCTHNTSWYHYQAGFGYSVNSTSWAQVTSCSYAKGSTSYGNISSASSGAYPSDSYSGDYWYVLKGNDTIDPSAVFYSTSAPKGGEMVDVTVTPGTNTYGGTVSYKYEYSLDGNTWTVANSGTISTTVSILIPAGSTQFQARVTASDDMGFTSPDAITGTALTVTNNTAPVIACDLSALGDITAAFNVAYSVSDADGNTMTITEALDGTAFNTFTTTGGNQTLTIDADRLLRALNGAHTLTITVDDGNGGVTTHSITFTKAVYTATITRAEPMDADDRIAIMVMHVVGSIPADADYKVEVTNNALDASPVWEDVTSYIKNDNIKNYSFANTTCTSGTWAFNFRVTVSRGASGTGGYITSLDGAFEGSVA